MRKIKIIRSKENNEEPVDMQVIVDNKTIACVFKKEENEVSFDLTNSEHTIQMGFSSRGKDYRSNAFFFLGKKDTNLIMKKSGSRITLLIKDF